MDKKQTAAQLAFRERVAATPAKVLAAMVEITINRDPAKTVVMINQNMVPQGEDKVRLRKGKHRLEAYISGKAGDSGTASVELGGNNLGSATAHIPAGMTEAFSPQETFDV